MLIEAVGWKLPHDQACERIMQVWSERRGRVPGLGHPLHKAAEPRAVTVRRLAQAMGGWGEHGLMLDAIEAHLAAIKGRKIPINLAGALAALLADLGFDPLVIGGLGALSYGVALLAHITEEIRDGVPLRIIPDALGAYYDGPEERHIPEQRNAR